MTLIRKKNLVSSEKRLVEMMQDLNFGRIIGLHIRSVYLIAIACIFTGYLAREFGERAFRVHRLAKDIAPGAPAAKATTHEK
ncbi:MAG: hypothetical protein FJ006_12390 [Chloroflexi bacterium]|nr:hypothetical protein [Chloroflexota bacterium]